MLGNEKWSGVCSWYSNSDAGGRNTSRVSQCALGRHLAPKMLTGLSLVYCCLVSPEAAPACAGAPPSFGLDGCRTALESRRHAGKQQPPAPPPQIQRPAEPPTIRCVPGYVPAKIETSGIGDIGMVLVKRDRVVGIVHFEGLNSRSDGSLI